MRQGGGRGNRSPKWEEEERGRRRRPRKGILSQSPSPEPLLDLPGFQSDPFGPDLYPPASASTPRGSL